PDDLPSLEQSRELQWEFDEVVKKYFYDACDRLTQKLLSRCGWDVINDFKGLTLIIICPNNGVNWHILRHLATFSDYLEQWPGLAKIRIYPPPGTGSVMEISVAQSFGY
ncbi:MAG TPA: hypothetical protein DCF68_19480, partial [Cyanothece sp. UBA12306]|nr:hypothetical protein [Cyanothece sp. UBA12306]